MFCLFHCRGKGFRGTPDAALPLRSSRARGRVRCL